MLEGIYLQRREATLAMQRLAAAPPPEGGCAEECQTDLNAEYLADMSQDLLKLAHRPTFEVTTTRKMTLYTKDHTRSHTAVHICSGLVLKHLSELQPLLADGKLEWHELRQGRDNESFLFR